MNLDILLTGILLCLTLIAGILFVILGEVTVRKLRKNPETKYELGMDCINGWDICHVGMALGLPKRLGRRWKKGPFGMVFADPDVLYKYTTKLDRILARIFIVPWTLIGLLTIVWMLIDLLGLDKN